MRRLLDNGRTLRAAGFTQRPSPLVAKCFPGSKCGNLGFISVKTATFHAHRLYTTRHAPQPTPGHGSQTRETITTPGGGQVPRPVGWVRATHRTKAFVSMAVGSESQVVLPPSQMLELAFAAKELLVAVHNRDTSVFGPAAMWLARKSNTLCLIAGCRAAATAAERSSVPKAPFMALVRSLVVTYAEDCRFSAVDLEGLLRDARYFDRQLILVALGESLQEDWLAARRSGMVLGSRSADSGPIVPPQLFARWRPALLTVHHLLLAMIQWTVQASEALRLPPPRAAFASGSNALHTGSSHSSGLLGPARLGSMQVAPPSPFMNASAAQTYRPGVPASQALYLQLHHQRAAASAAAAQQSMAAASGQASASLASAAASALSAAPDRSGSGGGSSPGGEASVEALRGCFRVMRTLTGMLGTLFAFPAPARALLAPTMVQVLAHGSGHAPQPWPFPRHPAWADAERDSEAAVAALDSSQGATPHAAWGGDLGSFASPAGGVIGAGAKAVVVGHHNRIKSKYEAALPPSRRHDNNRNGNGSGTYNRDGSRSGRFDAQRDGRGSSIEDVQTALHKYVLHLLAAVQAAAATKPNVLLGLSQEAPTLALLSAAAAVLRVDASLRMLVSGPGGVSQAPEGFGGGHHLPAAAAAGLLADRLPLAPPAVFGNGSDPFAPALASSRATSAAANLPASWLHRQSPAAAAAAPSTHVTATGSAAHAATAGSAPDSSNAPMPLQPHPLLRQLHAACVALQASRVAVLGPYHSTSASSFSLLPSSRWETTVHAAVMAVIAERSPRLEDTSMVPVRHPLLETGQRPDAAWPLYRVCIEYDGADYHAANDAGATGSGSADAAGGASAAAAGVGDQQGDEDDPTGANDTGAAGGSLSAGAENAPAVEAAAQAAVVSLVCERMQALLPSRKADGGAAPAAVISAFGRGGEAPLWQPSAVTVEQAGEIQIHVPLRLIDAAAAGRLQVLQRQQGGAHNAGTESRNLFGGAEGSASAVADVDANAGASGLKGREPTIRFRLRQWVGAISLDRWLVRLHRAECRLPRSATTGVNLNPGASGLSSQSQSPCPLCSRSQSAVCTAAERAAARTETVHDGNAAAGSASAFGGRRQSMDAAAQRSSSDNSDPWADDVPSDEEERHQRARSSHEDDDGAGENEAARAAVEPQLPGLFPLPPRAATCRFALKPVEALRLAQLLRRLARRRFPEAYGLKASAGEAAKACDTSAAVAAVDDDNDVAAIDDDAADDDCGAVLIGGSEPVGPSGTATADADSASSSVASTGSLKQAQQPQQRRQNERTRFRDEMMRAFGWRVVTITSDDWTRWTGGGGGGGGGGQYGRAAWDARSFGYSRKLPKAAKEEIVQRLLEAGLPLSR